MNKSMKFILRCSLFLGFTSAQVFGHSFPEPDRIPTPKEVTEALHNIHSLIREMVESDIKSKKMTFRVDEAATLESAQAAIAKLNLDEKSTAEILRVVNSKLADSNLKTELLHQMEEVAVKSEDDFSEDAHATEVSRVEDLPAGKKALAFLSHFAGYDPSLGRLPIIFLDRIKDARAAAISADPIDESEDKSSVPLSFEYNGKTYEIPFVVWIKDPSDSEFVFYKKISGSAHFLLVEDSLSLRKNPDELSELLVHELTHLMDSMNEVESFSDNYISEENDANEALYPSRKKQIEGADFDWYYSSPDARTEYKAIKDLSLKQDPTWKADELDLAIKNKMLTEYVDDLVGTDQKGEYFYFSRETERRAYWRQIQFEKHIEKKSLDQVLALFTVSDADKNAQTTTVDPIEAFPFVKKEFLRLYHADQKFPTGPFQKILVLTEALPEGTFENNYDATTDAIKTLRSDEAIEQFLIQAKQIKWLRLSVSESRSTWSHLLAVASAQK